MKALNELTQKLALQESELGRLKEEKKLEAALEK